ncbi:unnamed protein product [Phyllotreta striolata]|uniref:RanBP2-type domain-containing protein n=1 Tax=Phyllotreta striolata TaxID=444603 RepID=A0A9N9U0G0_PHYSR|nr:unnamed protein product [Phyllotreta striolata]
MVIMENCCLPENSFNELLQEIERCHLSFLELEESREKIDKRNKLEEYIHDYLSVSGHYHKFTFYETQQILQYSATYKKDFSAYKAALGFNAIQMYAGNLLAQPWRKEYRTLKTYCGFYKHQVEANLLGADKLFIDMGYRYLGEGLLVLEGPICPDRVTAVSRDCLIAYVECQILKAIWEEVYKTFKISWLEVLEFRTKYICSPEECIIALKSQHHHRQYQEHTRSLSQGSPNNYTVSVPIVTPVMPMNHSFPPSHHHHHQVGLPLQQEYAVVNGCCSGNYGNYTIPYSQPVLRPPEYSYIPMATVPTAKLIEIDSNRSHDTVDHPKPPAERRQTKRPTENNYNNTVKNGLDANKDSQLKDWEYVYNSLESQGYTKDLGERGDILSPDSSKQTDDFKTIKQTNLDEAVRQTFHDRPLKVSDTPKKPQKSPNDCKAVSKDKAASEKTLEKDKSARKKLLSKLTNEGKPGKWECKACTFINDTSKDICEMCSKSRIIKDETPIEIGGAECSQCTLVNSKNNDKCEACGLSLVGSPTYI